VNKSYRLTAYNPSRYACTIEQVTHRYAFRAWVRSVNLHGEVITVDAFCHLPDLQDVIFSHAGNDPFLARIPRQFWYLGCVASMDEQQLRWYVVCVLLWLLIANPKGTQHRESEKGKGRWSKEMVTNKTRAFASACIWIYRRPVHLVYKPYFFSQRTVFFSHNKSANGTISPCWWNIPSIKKYQGFDFKNMKI